MNRLNRKSKIHTEVMTFLNHYLENTPKEIIKEEIATISRKKFAGESANSYFLNLHKHYVSFDNSNSINSLKKTETPLFNKVQKRSKIFSIVSSTKSSNSISSIDRKSSQEKYEFSDTDRFNSFKDKSSISNTINKKYDEYF
jgi:hypothetical protein